MEPLNCESKPLTITLNALAALQPLDPPEFDAKTRKECAPGARAAAGVAEHGEPVTQPAAVAE
jgi:hypothetical protein